MARHRLLVPLKICLIPHIWRRGTHVIKSAGTVSQRWTYRKRASISRRAATRNHGTDGAPCELGGAVAIRCQGLSDIAAIKGRVKSPLSVFGKKGHEGVYITPTLRHALAVVNAVSRRGGADATDRARPDGRTFAETVRSLRERTDALVMPIA